MRIGEIAQQLGLKPSAIRFYEASGLLPASPRALNGYRDYGPETVKRLRMIQLAQRLGFGLEQLRELFRQADEPLPRAQVLAGLAQRRQEIARLRAELDAQEQELIRLQEQCETQWAQGECVELGDDRGPSLPRPQRRGGA